jgi:nitrogen-specific signal transduction histidine kinase
MGLGITYNIMVRKHRGDMSVQSEPVRTVFKVSFPIGA